MTKGQVSDVVLSAMQDIPNKEIIRKKSDAYCFATSAGREAIRKADPEWANVYDATDALIAKYGNREAS